MFSILKLLTRASSGTSLGSEWASILFSPPHKKNHPKEKEEEPPGRLFPFAEKLEQRNVKLKGRDTSYQRQSKGARGLPIPPYTQTPNCSGPPHGASAAMTSAGDGSCERHALEKMAPKLATQRACAVLKSPWGKGGEVGPTGEKERPTTKKIQKKPNADKRRKKTSAKGKQCI